MSLQRPRFPLRLFALTLSALLFSGESLPGQSGGEFRLAPRIGAFSPNSDGVQDTILLKPVGLPAGTPVRDWILEIKDARGELVRSYRGDARLLRPARKLSNLFLPSRTDVEPVRLFESLQWDGRGENGGFVPEGIYAATLIVYDLRGLERRTSPAQISVSNASPQAFLQAQVSLFVRAPGAPPPGRGPGERLEILQRAESAPGSRFTARLLNGAGETVLEREWQNVLPERVFIYWDDLDAQDEDRYGVYTYQLSVRDPAGNRASTEYADLIFAPRPVELDLRAERYVFSPNGDGVRDSLSLEFVPINSLGAPAVRGVSPGSPFAFSVHAAPGDEPLYVQRGVAPLPREFVWDGRDSAGDMVGDGVYHARIVVRDATGRMESVYRPVRADTEGPDANLAVLPDTLRNERVGLGGFAGVDLRVDDPSGIDYWSLRVRLTPRRPAGKQQADWLYRSFQGRGAGPEPFAWNGSSDAGLAPQSLERFTVEFDIRDRAGNVRSVRRAGEIVSGVLLRPARRGSTELVARLPLQDYFEADEDGELKLTDAGEDALDRVAARLGRYPQYYLSLEGHAARPGREEENLRRSEAYAQAMFDYFEDAGYERDRLLFRGYGETEPIAPGMDPVADYRNERLDVRLVLDGKKPIPFADRPVE